MSTDDIGRIMDLLRENGERLASLETTVHTLDIKIDKYNGLKDKVSELCTGQKLAVEAVEAVKLNCKVVQDKKASTRIPWQNIVPSLITGILMIIAGALFALILK